MTKEFFDVFTEEIRLDVHMVTDVAFAQGSDFKSVRNNPDSEASLLHFGYCQTNAIDCNRPFENDVTHQLGRGLDFQEMIVADSFPQDNPPHFVDVARDKMATESPI